MLNVHDLKLNIFHDVESLFDFLLEVFHGVLVILLALLNHFGILFEVVFFGVEVYFFFLFYKIF